MVIKKTNCLVALVLLIVILVSCKQQIENDNDFRQNSIIKQDVDPNDEVLFVDTVDVSDVENGKIYQEIKYQVITYNGNQALQDSLDILNTELKEGAEKFKEENKEEIRNFIKEMNMEEAMYTYTDDINYTRHDDTYLSLTVFNYVDLMGAHGSYIRKGYTYDVKTGRKLDLMDFVRDKEELKSFLKTWINEHSQDGEFFPYAEDVVDDYMNGDFNLQYNIDADSLYVTFQTYDIAPYAVGLIEVKIDDSLLKEKIR